MALKALAAIARPACRPLLVRGLRDEHRNCIEAALQGYVKLGAYSADEADALRPLTLEFQSELRFYSSWLLARFGDQQALARLADQMSFPYIHVDDWFGDGQQDLSNDRLMELLTPLVPGIRARTPTNWAAPIQKELGNLRWDAP